MYNMSIIWFFLFTEIALFIYWLFYHKTKDPLNPVGIMIFIFTLMAGVCHLNLGAYQTAWCYKTYLLILLSICTMTVTGLALVKDKRARKIFAGKKTSAYHISETQMSYFKKWIYFIVVFSLLCSVWTMVESGVFFNNAFHAAEIGHKGNWRMSSSPLIEYFTFMLPSVSVACYFILQFSDMVSWKDKFFCYGTMLYTVLYTTFVMVSRGTLLILLLGCLYIRHRKKHFSIAQIIRTALILVFFFGLFSIVRWADYSSGTEAVYSGKTGSFIFNSVYNYIVYCFQNFDTLVRRGSPMTGYMYNLAPIAKLFGLYDKSRVIYLSIKGFNACIFLTGAFHDLGAFGVFLYSMIDVTIVSILYNLSNKNESFSICVGILQRGIYVLFFAEYIFMLNGQNLLLFISIPLVLFTSKGLHFVVRKYRAA